MEFSDPDIVQAMRLAALEFNGLAPFSMTVSPSALPDSVTFFLDATAEILYRIKLHSLERNALKYTGGNVQVDTDNIKIDYLQKRVKELAEWRKTAQTFKLKADTSRYYRSMG